MAPPQTPDTISEPLRPAGRPGAAVLDDLPLIGCVVALAAGPRRAELATLFARRGARVVEIGMLATADEDGSAERAAERLAESVIRREVHSVVFNTSAEFAAVLDAAEAAGQRTEPLGALRADVTALCADPVCARPLELLGVSPLWPDRPRLGALVSALCTGLPPRIRKEVPLTIGRTLVLQGFAAVIDDTPAILPPLPAAVLAELARQPGWVVSRADLLRRVWAPRGVGAGKRDEHAVEATIARLRAALGPNAALIRTVTKRGYRLAVEGESW
jgi:uroporphyrinogen-III synthase